MGNVTNAWHQAELLKCTLSSKTSSLSTVCESEKGQEVALSPRDASPPCWALYCMKHTTQATLRRALPLPLFLDEENDFQRD